MEAATISYKKQSVIEIVGTVNYPFTVPGKK
jgi:hypothetical protein